MSKRLTINKQTITIPEEEFELLKKHSIYFQDFGMFGEMDENCEIILHVNCKVKILGTLVAILKHITRHQIQKNYIGNVKSIDGVCLKLMHELSHGDIIELLSLSDYLYCNGVTEIVGFYISNNAQLLQKVLKCKNTNLIL